MSLTRERTNPVGVREKDTRHKKENQHPYENQHPDALAKRKRAHSSQGNSRVQKWQRGQSLPLPLRQWTRGQTLPPPRRDSKHSSRRQPLFSIAYINLQDVGIDESKLEAKIDLAKRLLTKADGLFVSEIWTRCREEESEFVQRMRAYHPDLFVRSQATTGVDSNCHVVYFFSTGDAFTCYGDKYCTPNTPVPISDAYDRFLPIEHAASGITIIGLHAYVEHAHGVIQKCLTMVPHNFIVMGDFNLRWTTLRSDHLSEHHLVLSNKKWDHIITSKDFSHGVKASVIKSNTISDHNAIKITVFS